jgi:hypothetical protein
MQPTDPNKALQRKILQGHVAAYIKAGGKIHVIESGFATINYKAFSHRTWGSKKDEDQDFI